MAESADGAATQHWAQVVMATLTLLLGLCLAMYALSISYRSPGDVILWADLGLNNAAFLLTALVAAVRGVAGGPRAHPWLLLAVGLLCYMAGGILYSIGETRPLPVTTPPLPDVCWLLFYPFAFAALLVLTARRMSMRVADTWLDSLLVGTGAFAVGLALLNAAVLPQVGSADPAFVVVNSLYLVGDLVVLVLVLVVAQAFNWRPPWAWWFLIVGGVSFAVADTLYLITIANDDYVEGTWIDLLWPMAALLIALAAVFDRPNVAPQHPRRHFAFLAPSLAIVAAAVVLMWRPPGTLEWVATISAGVTILLAVVRLNMDVQQSLRLSEQLRRSLVDPLTGLPNRRALLDLGAGGHRTCSLILLDLDSFKDVNDTMGHEAGDRLLAVVAERLRSKVRASDLVARLGGDEFGVVLWDTDVQEASASAEQLVRALESPITVDGIPLLVTACAGVVASGVEPADFAVMLRHADIALYTAKAGGAGLVHTTTGADGAQSAARLRLRAMARASLESGGAEFVVHYQPIVSLVDGTLLAVEALVRWQHEGHLLPPAQFLPEMVRGGQMADLTRLMLTKSLRETGQHGLLIPVTVNVPPELMTEWILGETARALSRTGARPERLIVEITEEAIMKDRQAVALVLAALRARGVRVLLDDFGTGWSGLSTLRDLIVDGFKIDQSFVSRLSTDPTAEAILRGVAAMAAELDVLVIYEGAETPADVDELARIGAVYMQGFATARPMPIEDLVHWVALRHVSLSS